MKRLKAFIVSLFLTSLFGYLIYLFTRSYLINSMSSSDAIRKKAVLINEENYLPNGHIDREYSFSYMFIVGEKSYSNDSHNSKLQVGDSILIEYDKDLPSINRPVK